MADYYVSLTMALPKHAVPQRLEALEDLTAIFKVGEALDSYSRRNWLIHAVELCASHYGAPRLSYLSQVATALDPHEADVAAQELKAVLLAIEQAPSSLAGLLGQDAWSDDEIRAMVQAEASPWGPLVDSDDGDELPYLVSFLVSQRALLRHAVEHDLCVAFAQTAPRH